MKLTISVFDPRAAASHQQACCCLEVSDVLCRPLPRRALVQRIVASFGDSIDISRALQQLQVYTAINVSPPQPVPSNNPWEGNVADLFQDLPVAARCGLHEQAPVMFVCQRVADHLFDRWIVPQEQL